MGLRARIIPVFVPTWSLPHRARRFGSAFAFPNGFTTTTLAPRGLCEKSPNLAAELPLPLGAAALALCFAFPNGFSVGTGATRSAKPPKTERGVFRLSKLAEKLPRSLFRLRRASPPPLGHRPALMARKVPRSSGKVPRSKPRRGKVPRLSAALLVSIRVCSVGRVRTRQKWRGARRCRGV